MVRIGLSEVVTWSRNPKEVSNEGSGEEHPQLLAKTKRPEVGRSIGFLSNNRRARMWSGVSKVAGGEG